MSVAAVVAPVWGFDVSTRRISMGVLSRDGSVAARTLSIEQDVPHKRLGHALQFGSCKDHPADNPEATA